VIDYVDSAGRRVRQAVKTLRPAKAESTKRDFTMQEGTYDDPMKIQKFTLNQPCERYEETHKVQRGFKTSKKFHIERLKAYFGSERFLGMLRSPENALVSLFGGSPPRKAGFRELPYPPKLCF
jgi:hypothetical protein